MSEIARIAKLKKIGICSLVFGGIFAIVSIIVPITMKNSIINGAKESAQLSQANENNWSSIPGPYDISILWNHYMFNCTNIWDVSQLLSYFILGCLHKRRPNFHVIWSLRVSGV